MVENFATTVSFLWSVADLLRGDFKQSQYGRIILPFTLLRRLECVLAPSKQAVLAEYDKRRDSDLPLDAFLKKAAARLGALLGGCGWIGISTPLHRQVWALVNQPALNFASLPRGLGYWLGSLALPLLIVVGRLLGPIRFITGRLVLILWLISFVLTVFLLAGFRNSSVLPRVETGMWGGLLLTFLLAIVGIIASFPIGVALALVMFGLGYPMALAYQWKPALWLDRIGVAGSPLVLSPYFVVAAYFELKPFSFNEAEVAELLIGSGLAMFALHYLLAASRGLPTPLGQWERND